MGGEDMPGERSSDPGDLLPLTPVVLNVLLALDDGERHGYGIMLEVKERTGGRVRLGRVCKPNEAVCFPAWIEPN